ncbi:MAG: hypothetical protein Q8M94_09055, partial [Ignavibacteria bacterium]|nr:hypothetical protein [Ignavibacteria bacterium]
MSYGIKLTHPITKETLEFDEPHHMRGGTYQVGGITRAHLNVTYNYAEHFQRVFGDENIALTDWQKMFGGGQTGIRRLYGMTGAESIPILEKAISEL